MPQPSMIVFTDLDGTLLDHDSYRPDAAQPALDLLRAAKVPVVLASSKTAAEIAPLRDSLGFADVPAIVENGAGLLQPGAGGETGGEDYARLRSILNNVPGPLRHHYQGFGDWGAGGIAIRTGLSAQDAALAAARHYSEPGLWCGPDDARAAFIGYLETQGVMAREGGRFLTLSFGGTKAGQMDAVLRKYGTPFSVALGDAPNDVEMLQTADLGIIVANPHRPPLPVLPGEAEGRIRRTQGPGPIGWNGAMLQVIVERGLITNGA